MPADEALLRTLLKKQAGVVARRQIPLREWDWVRWQLRSKRWQRAHAGLFVSGTATINREQWRWIGLLGGGEGAALYGPTAALLGGLDGFETTAVHVCIPAKRRGPAIPGVRYHRARGFESDVAPEREPRRIALPSALIAMALSAPSDSRAQDVLTSAVQQGLIRTEELRVALSGSRNLRRRALILETLLDIEDGAQSLNEVAMLALIRAHGFPRPALQISIATDRRRSRLDGGWPQYAVCFEIDGIGHFEIDKWLDDADRQNEVALAQPSGTTLL